MTIKKVIENLDNQMRLFKSIMTGLLLFFSSHMAFAQWVGIASSSDRGGYDVYLDPHSRTLVDEGMKFWLLFDFKTLQQYADSTFLSYEIELEVNCVKQQGRILGFLDFTEPMGSGEPNRISVAPQNWVSLNSSGKDELIWNLACSESPTAFSPELRFAKWK